MLNIQSINNFPQFQKQGNNIKRHLGQNPQTCPVKNNLSPVTSQNILAYLQYNSSLILLNLN